MGAVAGSPDPGPGQNFLFALGWHDVTCPEGSECRSRNLHAASEPLYLSGLLERYEERTLELAHQHIEVKLAALRAENPRWPDPPDG